MSTDRHPLRVIVVDDEQLARQVLREYLSAMPDVTVVAECANGFEAVKAITENAPDLVLLDVQMPKLDGFEVLELAGRRTPVVFVTAYDEFAVRAFDVHAVDYLLKPVSPERLAEAVERARERLGRTPEPVPPGLAREGRGARTEPVDRILVRDGSKVHIIDVDDLDFVQARDDYVGFHAGGREYLKEQPLGDVESQLDPRHFVRIHRSFIVNLDRVARVEPLTRDSRIVILKDGRRLPVSRSGYQRLTDLLDGR
ncbi:MAG TPA: LytTR family DNA-binding domain-containing protein [Vicinamibacterales bacterium]